LKIHVGEKEKNYGHINVNIVIIGT